MHNNGRSHNHETCTILLDTSPNYLYPVYNKTYPNLRTSPVCLHAIHCFAAYSANQSDYRKHVTSLITRHRPTRSRLHAHMCILYTCITYMYIRPGAIHSQNRRQAVYPFKKEQEKAILAFTQGRDVSVALPTSYGKSLLVQVRYKGRLVS